MLEDLPIPRADDAPWAVFLDVDGTLLELADHPDLVVVPQGLLPLLYRLRALLGGALGLISGRSLATLDLLIGAAKLDAAGCHGAELRIAGRVECLAATGSLLTAVAGRLVSLVEGFALTIVEMKAHSIALHYRSAVLAPAAARRFCEQAVGAHADRLRLLEGKQVFEILPMGVGKGVAIAHFMERPPYAGRVPVFVGDDLTDEEGFQEVNMRGGISMRVGATGPSAARYRVDGVTDVMEWLAGPVCSNLDRHVRAGLT